MNVSGNFIGQLDKRFVISRFSGRLTVRPANCDGLVSIALECPLPAIRQQALAPALSEFLRRQQPEACPVAPEPVRCGKARE